MKRKRICFVTQSFLGDPSVSINGTQVQSYILAREFAIRGYEVHYLAETDNGKRGSTSVANGIKLHWVVRPFNPWFLKWRYREYWQTLTAIAPDICYQRGRSYLTYVAALYAKKFGSKFVWASNGEDGCEPRKFVPKLMKSDRPFWKKILLLPRAHSEDRALRSGISMANHVVNQTQVQLRDLQRYFGKTGKIIKSALPIPDPMEKSKDPRVILWLASLSPVKQPEIFISLARRFSARSGWRFLLVGGSRDEKFCNKITRLSKNLSNLQMVGAIPFKKSSEYFGRASIFVNTSRYEGLSNTLVQAWLAGTPTVTLSHDPDRIIQDQQLGFCARGDLQRLEEGLKLFIENRELRKLTSKRARDYAVATFDPNKILDEYEALF